MKAAGKSEWATYGALAVAAALALLLVMARPLPAGLKTTWVALRGLSPTAVCGGGFVGRACRRRAANQQCIDAQTVGSSAARRGAPAVVNGRRRRRRLPAVGGRPRQLPFPTALCA